jgi:hypothetical protein
MMLSSEATVREPIDPSRAGLCMHSLRRGNRESVTPDTIFIRTPAVQPKPASPTPLPRSRLPAHWVAAGGEGCSRQRRSFPGPLLLLCPKIYANLPKFPHHPHTLSHFCSLKVSVLVRGVNIGRPSGRRSARFPPPDPALPRPRKRGRAGDGCPKETAASFLRGPALFLQCSLRVPDRCVVPVVIPGPGGLLRVPPSTPTCAINRQPAARSQQPRADSR